MAINQHTAVGSKRFEFRLAGQLFLFF